MAGCVFRNTYSYQTLGSFECGQAESHIQAFFQTLARNVADVGRLRSGLAFVVSKDVHNAPEDQQVFAMAHGRRQNGDLDSRIYLSPL